MAAGYSPHSAMPYGDVIGRRSGRHTDRGYLNQEPLMPVMRSQNMPGMYQERVGVFSKYIIEEIHVYRKMIRGRFV